MEKKPDIPFSERLGLVGLWCLAVAQPIYLIIFKDGSLFSGFGMSAWESLWVVLAVAWIPPLLLVLFLSLLGRISPKAAIVCYYASVVALAATVTLILIRDWYWFPLGVHLLLALLAGFLVAVLLKKYDWVKGYFRLFTVSALIFPALYVMQSGIFDPGKTSTWPDYNIPVKQPVPIVMVVFDEFPLGILLDKNGRIDRERFPNFANLANNAHWFENALSVHSFTDEAVPAILSGKYPPKTSPDSCLVRPLRHYSHPDNLFSLLQHSYRMDVHETFIRLCPDKVCASGDKTNSRAPINWSSFFKSLAGQFIVDVVMDRPEFDWLYYKFRFWRDGSVPQTPPGHLGDIAMFHTLAEHMTVDVQQGTAGNTLYFIHPLLPHYTWEYTRDGRRYAASPVASRTAHPPYCTRMKDSPLCRSDWRSKNLYQRLLIQTEYTDRLLGKLLATMKQNGLYDPSLLIVTADHGVSLEPGEPIRDASKKNLQDIMFVPLLIKTPDQQQGVTHSKAVQTVDILPTIADVLDIQIPWTTDGRSILDRNYRLPEQAGICARKDWFPIDLSRLDDLKKNSFANRPDELFNLTPYRHVLNRQIPAKAPVSTLNVRMLVPQMSGDTPAIEALYWFGELSPQAINQPVYIAAVANGRVISLTQAYRPFPNDTLLFDILLPESAIEDLTVSDIHFYQVQGPVHAPEFLKLR